MTERVSGRSGEALGEVLWDTDEHVSDTIETTSILTPKPAFDAIEAIETGGMHTDSNFIINPTIQRRIQNKHFRRVVYWRGHRSRQI
jgi:hypothetical protein